MSVKEEIAKSNLERNKELHGKKPWELRSVRIFGAQKEGSIGQSIWSKINTKTAALAVCDDRNVTVYAPPGIMSGTSAIVCCQGKMSLNWFEEESAGTAREIIDTNLFGSYRIAQTFVRQTINDQFRKKIIFIGSMAYRQVLNGSAAYCASKAGLAMLTRCLAWELGPKGYDVYCINPGNVENTPMAEETKEKLQRFRNLSAEEAEEYWSQGLFRDKHVTKDEIAQFVLYLLGDGTGHLSGSNFEMNGGMR